MEFLQRVKDSTTRLLPQATPRAAVQLPIPQTPFEQYRRNKLIQLLGVQYLVSGKSVLEIGCGMGDLLLELSRFQPRELFGVDSSEEVLSLARDYLGEVPADLALARVDALPFPDQSFDIVIAMSEFQYIQQDEDLAGIASELCRVSRQWIVLVEQTAPTRTVAQEGTVSRPVAHYQALFKQRDFFLRSFDLLKTGVTAYVFTGKSNPWLWVRWALSPLLYLLGFPRSWLKPPLGREEVPNSRVALLLQKYLLPLLAPLDEASSSQQGATVLRFQRKQLFRRK
jgi:SAM-dependent methyltransferase